MSGDKKDNDEGLVSSSSSTLPKKRRLTAGYWLQSMDLASVAGQVFNWDAGQYEIVGSTGQFATVINANLDRLEAGQPFTLLINLGGRHWTTMVLTLDPTSGNPVAFFADSFGVRRNAIFASVDLSNNQLLSYEYLKTILSNIMRGNGHTGIEFRDISTTQQTDSSSCGIYALENARLLNQYLSSGESLSNLGSRLGSEPIDVEELRQRFAEVLQDEAFVEDEVVQEQEEEEKQEEEKQEEEEKEDVHLALWGEYVANPTGDRLVTYLLSLYRESIVTNYDDANMQRLLGVLRRGLNKVARDHGQMMNMFDIFIDVLAQAPDVLDAVTLERPPHELLEELTIQAESILGPVHPLTFKIYLLRIILVTDTREEAQEVLEKADLKEHIRELYEQMPRARPVGELRLDLIEYKDAIRSIRNYFAVAALMRASGNNAMARTVLESAATSLLNAEVNADYAQMRPGGLHLVDLVFLGGRILREMADLALEEGRVFDAAGHLIRTLTTELSYRSSLALPGSYANFLNFALRLPGFSDDQLVNFMTENLQLGLMIPARLFDTFACAVRVRAVTLRLIGQSEEAVDMLSTGLSYAGLAISQMQADDPVEGAFCNTVERSWYQLAVARHTIQLATAQDDRALVETHMEFLDAVLARNLQEDHAGPEFQQSMAEFLAKLEHFRLADPGFVVSIARQLENRFRSRGDETSFFSEVGPQCFAIMARSYLEIGDVRQFVLSSYTTLYMALKYNKAGTEQCRINLMILGAALNLIESHLTSLAHIDASTRAAHMGMLSALRVWQTGMPEHSGQPGQIQSLEFMAAERIVQDYEGHIRVLESILDLPEMTSVLATMAQMHREGRLLPQSHSSSSNHREETPKDEDNNNPPDSAPEGL